MEYSTVMCLQTGKALMSYAWENYGKIKLSVEYPTKLFNSIDKIHSNGAHNFAIKVNEKHVFDIKHPKCFICVLENDGSPI